MSGQQLRCDVIVDEIFQIEIETTTHELFLDDSPEEFIIRASNEEGTQHMYTVSVIHVYHNVLSLNHIISILGRG